MAYFGISDFSLIGGSLKSSSDSSLYSLLSNYSQTKAVASAVNTLKSSSLSAKNEKESSKINERLSIIMDNFSNSASSTLNTSWGTSSENTTITAAAKKMADEMYSSVTKTGTTVNETV